MEMRNDVLLAHRRLHRGPKIVAIGGGTGLSTLLRLKAYSANITAIVTADDGGSSGRLRREIGVLPPEIFAIVWHWQMRKVGNGTVSVSVPEIFDWS